MLRGPGASQAVWLLLCPAMHTCTLCPAHLLQNSHPFSLLPFLVRLEKPHTSNPERPGSGRVPLSWERGLQLKHLALGWFLYSVDAGRFRALSAPAWVSWLVSSFLCQGLPPSWGRIKKTRGQKSGSFGKETTAVGRRDKA